MRILLKFSIACLTFSLFHFRVSIKISNFFSKSNDELTMKITSTWNDVLMNQIFLETQRALRGEKCVRRKKMKRNKINGQSRKSVNFNIYQFFHVYSLQSHRLHVFFLVCEEESFKSPFHVHFSGLRIFFIREHEKFIS